MSAATPSRRVSTPKTPTATSPLPGRISRLDLPTGPGIRVDTGVSEGDTIPADFDSMIAKIIAYGSDRDQALGRLRRAMAQTGVIIEGGATNKSFVLDLLNQPEVIDGSADTGWIDRVRAQGRLVAAALLDRLGAAGDRCLRTGRDGRARPSARDRDRRPSAGAPRADAPGLQAPRRRLPRPRRPHWGRRFRVVIEGGGDVRTADVELERFDQYAAQMTVNGRRYRLLTDTHGPDLSIVDVGGSPIASAATRAASCAPPARHW